MTLQECCRKWNELFNEFVEGCNKTTSAQRKSYSRRFGRNNSIKMDDFRITESIDDIVEVCDVTTENEKVEVPLFGKVNHKVYILRVDSCGFLCSVKRSKAKQLSVGDKIHIIGKVNLVYPGTRRKLCEIDIGHHPFKDTIERPGTIYAVGRPQILEKKRYGIKILRVD